MGAASAWASDGKLDASLQHQRKKVTTLKIYRCNIEKYAKKKLTMELDSEIENCCCHMSTKFHATVTVKHVETIAATSNIWAHLLFFIPDMCVYIYIFMDQTILERSSMCFSSGQSYKIL